MKKRKVMTSIVFVLSTLAGIGSALAAQTLVDPYYNSSSNLYAIEFLKRGDVYSTINVNRNADSNSRIWAQYWVGHPYTKSQPMGVIHSYDSTKMSLVGVREPAPNAPYNNVLNYKIESDSFHPNIRDVIANGTVDPNKTGYIGFQYQLKTTSQKFDYSYYGSSAPHHSLSGYMIDYIMSWTDDVTVVNGNNMYIYQ
ncbi:hypothetical protein KDJ56_17395 [Brevibacillus composti]|uniref:Uncharacterized protein n=1 Tax=Brevibacillus composti TaxID=2796470 RepID=A0A7T5EJF4_9BACL|nr:hypothetical protein [Brevibacillus composti]QQE73655.1 hypothetical protein JD108_17450 [Brevibacillus composti]QUO40737.1 hypothetical protein KDJ56_17395 [Brevibacillus composti]